MIHLEEALIPLTGADRLVGRRAEDLPGDAPVLAGPTAFRLHDTYGFPVDLTVELAAEYGVAVDRPGFDQALAEQRDRSRGGRKAELARHAELMALYDSLARRAGRHARSWATTRRRPRAGSWRSCATDWSTKRSNRLATRSSGPSRRRRPR